jgi:CP family cyanate transporter-like MFS transporter
MAQGIGYTLAAVGPILIGAVHDGTGSWTIAMAVLACAAIPQGLAALRAAKAGKMAPDSG